MMSTVAFHHLDVLLTSCATKSVEYTPAHEAVIGDFGYGFFDGARVSSARGVSFF